MLDEGVVKYTLEFSKDVQAVTQTDIKEIEKVRKKLYSYGLIGAYEDGIGYGNISQKDPRGGFFITGTQTGHKEKLDASDYSKVENVDIRNFTSYAKGIAQPSSEAISHEAIYRLDEHILAVIHIHNEALWNYLIEKGFKTTKDVPYGSPEMVESIFELYEDQNFEENIFAMRGHFEGVFIFGDSLKKITQQLINLYKRASLG